MPRSNDWWIAAILAIAVAVVFSAVLKNDFVLDSEIIVRDNPRIIEHRFGEIFTSDWWHRPEDQKTLYRPVTMSFLALVATLSPTPKSFNAWNIALHAAVAIARYFLLLRILRGFPTARLLAASISLVAALHAVAGEAVVGIVGAAEMLMSLFAVFSWMAIDSYAREKDPVRGVVALAVASVAYLAALLCKENAVFLPIVWWAHLMIEPGESAPTPGRTKRIIIALLAASAAFGLWLVLRRAVLGSVVAFTNDTVYDGFTTMERVATALAAFGATYLPKLIIPFDLAPNLTHAEIAPRAGLFDLGALAGLIFWAGIVIGGVWLTMRRSIAGLGLILAAVVLLPTSNLVIPIGAVAAYRFWYLPLFGLLLAGAVGIARVRVARPSIGNLLIVACAAMCVAGAVGSTRLVEQWRDNASLFASAIAIEPTSAWALQNDSYVNYLSVGNMPPEKRLESLNRLDGVRDRLPKIPSSGKPDLQSSISFYRLLMNRAAFRGTVAANRTDILLAQRDALEAESYATDRPEYLFDARLAGAQLAVTEFELVSRNERDKAALLAILDKALTTADRASDLLGSGIPRQKRAALELSRYRIMTHRVKLEPEAEGAEKPEYWLEEALKSDPDNVDGRLLNADRLRRAGKHALALAEIEHLERVGRLTVTGCDIASQLSRTLGKAEESKQWMTRALRLPALSPAEQELQQRMSNAMRQPR